MSKQKKKAKVSQDTHSIPSITESVGYIELLNQAKSLENVPQDFIDHIVDIISKDTFNMTFDNSPTVAWRSRKTGSVQEGYKHFSRTEDMLSPPAELVRLGRCNKPGKPVLYAANSIETSLLECDAHIGDVFQVVRLKFRRSMFQIGTIESLHKRQTPPFHYSDEHLGRVTKIFRSIKDQCDSNTDPHAFERTLPRDAFCRDWFSRDAFVIPGTYKVTSSLAEFVGKGCAIVFPSVKNGGINYAVMDGSDIKFKDTMLVEVTKILPYGEIEFRELRSGHIDPDNSNLFRWITFWEDSKNPQDTEEPERNEETKEPKETNNE